MIIYPHTIEHLEMPDVQNTTQSVMSIVREVRNKMSFVSDIIKPGIQGIFYTAGGALFTYAYRLFTQQKSYAEGYMEGCNKCYSEGFNKGYNEGFNQIALIAGTACIGAAVGAAAAIMCYAQHKQQNTRMTDARVHEVPGLLSPAM